MREFLRRRVPQSLLAYFVAGWGVLQFVEFLEERYTLTPDLVERVAVSWLLLLPSVFVLAWIHGEPGGQRWSRRQGALVSTNLVVIVGVLLVAFGGRQTGAATTTVTVEDENGARVEREVPTAAARHALMLSFPDTSPLDEDDRWAGPALAYLLENDLFQNPFVEVRSPWGEEAASEQAGVSDPTKMPRALIADIAERRRADFHLVGSVSREGEDWIGRFELVVTNTGERLDTIVLRDADLFTMTDALTVWLVDRMGLPRSDGDLFPDRPVADLVSNEPGTLRPLVTAFSALVFDNDAQTALREADAALALDPTSCAAWMQKFSAHLMLTQYPQAVAAIDAAMTHAYRMSERGQFLVRAQYYGIRNDAEKAMAVLRMWSELMPGDPLVHRMLAVNYGLLGRPNEAVASYERRLELIPDDVVTLEAIADLYMDLGRPDAARRALQRKVELQPDEASAHLALARVLRESGDLEAASRSIEQALLLEPTDPDARILAADLETRKGRPERAEAELTSVLDSARGDHARVDVLDALIDLHVRRGRMDRALSEIGQWEEVAPRVLPVPTLAVRSAVFAPHFVTAGRPEEADARLASLRESVGYPIDRIVSLGEVLVALERRDPERARAAVDELDTTVRELNLEILRPRLTTLRAEVSALAGDHERAVALCDSARSLYVTYRRALLVRARSEIELGRPDAAVESLREYLASDPANPWANLEFAKALTALERGPEAREHLDVALRTWSDADSTFADARIARALGERLRARP